MPMSPRLLRPRASGGGFDPRSIPSLGMWWDASNASSVTLNGTNVSQISDLSGNARNLSNATASQQPAYNLAGRNGLNVITSSGTTSLHCNIANTGTLFTISSQSIFWVFWPTVEAVSNARVYTQSIPGNPDFSGTNHFLPTYFSSNATLAIFANSTQASLSITAGAPVVISCIHTGSSFNHRANRGTQANGTSTLSNTSFANASLFFGGGARGDIGECIVYNNRACSEAERTAVERYLAQKWGVTVAA